MNKSKSTKAMKKLNPERYKSVSRMPSKGYGVRGRPAHTDCQNPALTKAIKMVGGTCALAKLMDIVPSSVSHWSRGRKLMTPQRAIQIEKITGGKVKREELRPDIFVVSKKR